MFSVGRPSSRARRGTRGISLLEALAATSFLSAAILAIGASSISLTRAAKSADSTGAATALALEKLERLRSMPLGATALTPGQYYDTANPLRADGTSGGIYDRSWTVSLNDHPTFGLRTVIVTVAWQDTKPHTARVAAYVRCSTVPCS